jgi:hypothetical protein
MLVIVLSTAAIVVSIFSIPFLFNRVTYFTGVWRGIRLLNKMEKERELELARAEVRRIYEQKLKEAMLKKAEQEMGSPLKEALSEN